jgi:hypothetical protein
MAIWERQQQELVQVGKIDRTGCFVKSDQLPDSPTRSLPPSLAGMFYETLALQFINKIIIADLFTAT